jgi:hypothetical protein
MDFKDVDWKAVSSETKKVLKSKAKGRIKDGENTFRKDTGLRARLKERVKYTPFASFAQPKFSPLPPKRSKRRRRRRRKW